MKRKKVFGLLFVILSLSLIFSVSAFATDVWIEGYGNMTKEYGDIFVNEDERTMVPVRAFAETIDCEVEWYESEKEVRLLKWYEFPNKKYLVTTSLFIGKNYVISEGGSNNGREYIDTEPMLFNDRTYIPLRIAAEMFDYIVEWDDETKSVKCYHK